jgi:hypothetical protein
MNRAALSALTDTSSLDYSTAHLPSPSRHPNRFLSGLPALQTAFCTIFMNEYRTDDITTRIQNQQIYNMEVNKEGNDETSPLQ